MSCKSLHVRQLVTRIRQVKKIRDPLSLQLAFQGGGAKVVCLIAVVEAIQELQRDKVLKVSRVAGTSAGSIAACLLASGIDAKLVRTELQSISSKELARWFPSPGINYRTLMLLGRGLPLWKQEVLTRRLERIFEQRGKVFTLGDLKQKTNIDVHVVASDLNSSTKVVFTDPNKKIIEAILDSCGLPYCFRTWSKGGSPVIVDGGLCENLPSDELEHYEQTDGPIVAISFDPERPNTPNNLPNFSKALFSTAINNSMSRARLRLGADRVFSIGTDISTFDFDKALNEGLKLQYELVKRQATDFFTEFIASRQRPRRTISSEMWKEQNISMMKTLGHLYEVQHLPHKVKYQKILIEVTANCLSNPSTPDYVRNSFTFTTADSPIYCHGISLIDTNPPARFERTDLSMIDATTGNLLEITGVPVLYENEVTTRSLLLYFTPVLAPASGPYTLNIKDAPHDLMKPLRETASDELVLQPLRALGSIDSIDLVVHWPQDAGQVVMTPKDSKGRVMTQSERFQYGAPAGFETVGWTGRDVPAEAEFGVNLHFIRRTS